MDLPTLLMATILELRFIEQSCQVLDIEQIAPRKGGNVEVLDQLRPRFPKDVHVRLEQAAS